MNINVYSSCILKFLATHVEIYIIQKYSSTYILLLKMFHFGISILTGLWLGMCLLLLETDHRRHHHSAGIGLTRLSRSTDV